MLAQSKIEYWNFNAMHASHLTQFLIRIDFDFQQHSRSMGSI